MSELYYFNADADGKRIPDLEAMAAKLLDDDILFLNDIEIGSFKTLGLWMNCNDLFIRAADSEYVSSEDLPVLFALHMRDRIWGSVIWASRKRKEKPLPSIVKKMEQYLVWDDSLNELRENAFYKIVWTMPV